MPSKDTWPTVADVKELSDAAFVAPAAIPTVTLAVSQIHEATAEDVGLVYTLLDHMEQAAECLRDESYRLLDALRSVEVSELDQRADAAEAA